MPINTYKTINNQLIITILKPITMTKLGIDKVKLVLSLGMSFGKQIETAAADNKFDWKDIPGFIPLFLQVQPVVEAGKEAAAQAVDLDHAERTELNEWAQDEFDLKNDEVEEKVEASLDFAISILIMYAVWKKKDATPPSAPPAK